MTASQEVDRWAVWEHSTALPFAHRLVLFALVDHADTGTGEAFPSVSRLTALVYGPNPTGWDRRRVGEHLADLVAAGHISDTGRTRGRDVVVWRVHPGGLDLRDPLTGEVYR